jgi:hypothetical protein
MMATTQAEMVEVQDELWKIGMGDPGIFYNSRQL